jgi:hypothetical protein
MADTDINDMRDNKEFKGRSFSGFKKAKVKQQLLNSLSESKIEPSCYWSAELICAGHYQDLWDIILIFIGKYIHLGNPKLPIYIDMRFNQFKTILTNGYIGNEIKLRNNKKIRSLFAEVITILCFSPKKYAIEAVKIKDRSVFDMTQMTNKLKAPNIGYASIIFKKDDPKELFIAINELAYNLKIKNCVSACFWVEWIIEFETICKKRKQKCVCERRQFAPVQDKFQCDIIWMPWEIILKEAEKVKSAILNKILQSLLNIFAMRYSSAVKKKRKFLIYYAVTLITENVNYNVNIIENNDRVEGVVKKIDIIYLQIKKNEKAPKTDYLFAGTTQQSNLDKTIDKLNIMY